MIAAEETKGPFEAAILAADEALAASLVQLFVASGIHSTQLGSVAALAALAAAGPNVIIVDWLLLKQATSHLGEAIGNWHGKMIVMMEDEQAPTVLPGAVLDRCMLLTKPFTSEDVICLVTQVMNSWPDCSALGAGESSLRLA